MSDTPNRWPWPPIVYLATIVAGFLVERHLVPTSHGGGLALGVLGIVAIAAGLGLDLWTAWTFSRARTTIMPHRGAKALVTWGPFRFSRNPIYVGNTLLTIGLGLVFDNLWLMALAFLAAFAVQKLAIEREEAHLARRFGAEWDAYAARVRRWI
ncbi:methyltransferase family protein [Salinarimonas ramus]|uniref:Isoprenylcysteine carboxyl methyltransferase n=1 Tax=Salinarimonas ramus TaxID=690164 RepID=A0A917Q5D7_9HYPH|nr:isoprenylcysteine carboxylmethyltransferase family protein [Salinarimonas ramus]GGK17592.1 isoprenylcysteine carboxyl methyltransferase [Salinarimonas ramus]